MPCETPYFVKSPSTFERHVPVPCGRCPICRKRRVNEWVFRMQKEDEVSTSSHFITLTYDTAFVPITKNGFMTLKKKDVQDFMKRLRKLEYYRKTGNKIRYYFVGEYGTKNDRPHYHAIIFNVTDENDIIKAWTQGQTHIGTVQGESIAYTVKYLDKPYKIPVHDRDDRQKEFSLMSQGLGKNYLTQAVKKYHKDDVRRNYVTGKGGHKLPMPKYYKDKIFTDEEKRQQRAHVKIVTKQTDAQLQHEYQVLYGDNPDYSFEQWQADKIFGRQNRAVNNYKTRKL